MTTFAQLSARLKNFLGDWLLILGIKEGLVECAIVCVKSVVILTKHCTAEYTVIWVEWNSVLFFKCKDLNFFLPTNVAI